MNQSMEKAGFPIRRIVYATDFLESSRLALDYAVAFAHRYDASLVLVHAFELSPAGQEVEMRSRRPCLSREAARNRLEGFASSVRRLGIKVETDLRDGDVCGSVLASAAAHQADLLVMGTHGAHYGLDHLLLGSNTEKILLAAPCPTLTAGRNVLGGIDTELKLSEILFISDFTTEATAAVRYALALAEEFRVPMEICQMLPENAAGDVGLHRQIAEQYCAAMKRMMPERGDWCDPAFHLERRRSAEEILARARVDPASLIVLGVRPQSHLGRHLHTSFAYELVGKATCPLLTVHSK
jgi:nucleotide-binding universal stress UspA family protein